MSGFYEEVLSEWTPYEKEEDELNREAHCLSSLAKLSWADEKFKKWFLQTTKYICQTKFNKYKDYAIQKSSADAVPLQKRTSDSQTVGEEVRWVQEKES